MQQDVDAFQAAVAARRLLPGQPNSAFDMVTKLRGELSPEQMFLQENALRVALENQAQPECFCATSPQTRLSQTRAEFEDGSKYMEAAMKLTPESLYLEGRDSFFKGRGLLYDKQYGQAAGLLQNLSCPHRSSRLYGYNTLGIAYLEQADFVKALPAFRDAAKKARNWSYPLHNLALAYVEAGDYENAIRGYQRAMKLTPQYSYTTTTSGWFING